MQNKMPDTPTKPDHERAREIAERWKMLAIHPELGSIGETSLGTIARAYLALEKDRDRLRGENEEMRKALTIIGNARTLDGEELESHRHARRTLAALSPSPQDEVRGLGAERALQGEKA